MIMVVVVVKVVVIVVVRSQNAVKTFVTQKYCTRNRRLYEAMELVCMVSNFVAFQDVVSDRGR